MESAAVNILQMVAAAALLALGLNHTIWGVIGKYNGWEYYDTYRRGWMPARTCELCTAFWITAAYAWPLAIGLSIALRAPAHLFLCAVPFTVAALTIRTVQK